MVLTIGKLDADMPVVLCMLLGAMKFDSLQAYYNIRKVGRVWFIAPVLKTGGCKKFRGFESYTFLMIYICDNKRHLVCLPYSKKNLHEVAKELNIGKHWFHKDHYDIPKKRVEEIMSHEKCVILSSKDIVRIINGTYRIKI